MITYPRIWGNTENHIRAIMICIVYPSRAKTLNEPQHQPYPQAIRVRTI